jgi:hypothetical protein
MVLSLADYISDDEPTSSMAHTLSRNHVEAHNESQLQHPLLVATPEVARDTDRTRGYRTVTVPSAGASSGGGNAAHQLAS